MHTIDLTNAWEPPAAGSRAWVRRFGRPSGVEPGDRRAATLNEQPLAWREADPGDLECDVTAVIKPRNTLVVPGDRLGPPESDASGRRAALPEAWGRLSLVIVSD